MSEFHIPTVSEEILGGGVRSKGNELMQIARDRGERDFQQIVGFLPQRADRVLDIGCGPGWLTLMIAKAVGAKQVTVVDGDGTGERRTGFGEVKAWADIRVAQALLVINLPGVDVVALHSDSFAVAPPAKQDTDLIISTKSWGHHYSIETYLPHVQQLVADEGALIIDIRHGTDGIAKLVAGGFDRPEEIAETAKCKRYRLTYQIRF